VHFFDEFFPFIVLAVSAPLAWLPIEKFSKILEEYPSLENASHQLAHRQGFYRVLFGASLIWSLQLLIL